MSRYQTFDEAAKAVTARFQAHQLKVTLGGEPSYLPVEPDGAEWLTSALGPTKLGYARAMAEALRAKELPGALLFQSQGKFYPGEPNPRWALQLLWNRHGKPVPGSPAWLAKHPPGPKPPGLPDIRATISRKLSVPDHWLRFVDPNAPKAQVWVLPLDHDGQRWISQAWTLPRSQKRLIPTEGPTGLRLPLQYLPENALRRALVLEKTGEDVVLFFPPLLQGHFVELLEIAAPLLSAQQSVRYEGYVPHDDGHLWSSVAFTPDPGVLEINLPPCPTVTDYAWWMSTLGACAEAVGLRSFKSVPTAEWGTGGGNHLLFGGPTLEENAFFRHPRWVTSILRYWQGHPCLSYLFTGRYVGPSSQAPRPDESARDHYDLEMAYRFLESLPADQDNRYLISETLRHLHIDLSGNTHRSEISFDKFWNVSWASGCRGLIEFRAVETLPHPDWMSHVALLWTCIIAMVFDHRRPKPLTVHGSRLHDYYFLPAALWLDFEAVLRDLNRAGFRLNPAIFRKIWEWRCPKMLDVSLGGATLTARKALEGWPLLCETPVEGGSTSRFVDTSMERMELLANRKFASEYRLFVQGREVPLHAFGKEGHLSGLRYRSTALYPSLHPGMPPHLPLQLVIADRKGKRVAAFELPPETRAFAKHSGEGMKLKRRPCRKLREDSLTFDLRLI